MKSKRLFGSSCSTQAAVQTKRRKTTDGQIDWSNFQKVNYTGFAVSISGPIPLCRKTKRAPDFRSQSQSEVAADRPMDFPALKRTKREENLDPSQEFEQELLAKEKRLARFKDELSQPVQSQSAKRQLPSTSGTQKLSEDPTTAGGNFPSDYEDLLSTSIVGLCPDMCPESERAERERKGDLDQYERVDGDRNRTSEFLAVKKYTRTAEREANLIRPMPILQKTMDYLLSLLDEPYDDRFLGLFNFLWDRMRAIRMDLRMQHVFNLEAIRMLEQMIRLHIIAMHELCEYTKGEGFSEGFDAHLNIEQMNKTSVELFQLYDDHRKRGIHVPSEREFRGYYALLKLDKHPGYKVEPAELSLDLAKMTPEMRQTPEVLFARDVARACRTGNFIAFFRLAQKASYVQACLMHAHFFKLRTQALASLHCGLQKSQGIPITLIAKWLGMEDEDIQDLLEYYGFSVKDFEEPYMVKENAFLNTENDFPVKRSNLVNRKRSSVIVGDVSFPPRNESCAVEEVKAFLPKAPANPLVLDFPVPKPTPKPSPVAVTTTELHDEEMRDLATEFSSKANLKNHVDEASIALTTPVKEIVGHEVQSAPANPLALDFPNCSSLCVAEFAHTPKFKPVNRNSFGSENHELEEQTPITLEASEDKIDFVDTPTAQPVLTKDSEDEEETAAMEDKEVEEAKLELMSWRLMSLTSGGVYVLAERCFPTSSSEALDKLESRVDTFLPPYVVHPSLDELVEAGCESNNMEYEGFQPLLPMTCNGDVDLVENEKVSEDGVLREENNDEGGPKHDAKATQEADKLSKLLEKCNMLQNMIDLKLYIYF